MKKTVLVVTDWYPTKENPIVGCFFKEQIELLSDRYKLVVIKIVEKRVFLITYLINKYVNKTLQLNLIEKYKDVQQYELTIFVPAFFSVIERIKGIFIKRFDPIDNVGKYYSVTYKNRIKKQMLMLKNMIAQPYDLVYGISSQGISYQASCLATIMNKPLIMGEHAPFPWPGQVVSNILKESLEKSDVFLAISNDKIRQVMLQNIRLRKICYVGNFVDEDIFQYKPIKHGRKTLLIVAAHSFYKNYDLFIDTMNKLKSKTNMKFKVVIAGYAANKGYSKDVEILEEKIANSDFSDCVELVKYVPRSEMSSLYNRVDAFVMTSIQEGQPVSALEAACCGLPIFATRCGGREDYVTEQIGRLVSITDSELLSEYLKQFVEDEISFDAEYIRRSIIEKFGKKKYLENMSSCFNELMD